MNNVKEIRLQRGMSQRDLAKALREYDPRIDAPLLCKIETGMVDPSGLVLEALEKALQCPRTALVGSLEEFAAEDTEPDITEYAMSVAKLVGSVVPRGHQNAISRTMLTLMLGFEDTSSGDRKMRKLIESAKLAGLLVCNDQDGQGYYIADTEQEKRAQLEQLESRSRSLLIQAKHYRRAL